MGNLQQELAKILLELREHARKTSPRIDFPINRYKCSFSGKLYVTEVDDDDTAYLMVLADGNYEGSRFFNLFSFDLESLKENHIKGSCNGLELQVSDFQQFKTMLNDVSINMKK